MRTIVMLLAGALGALAQTKIAPDQIQAATAPGIRVMCSINGSTRWCVLDPAVFSAIAGVETPIVYRITAKVPASPSMQVDAFVASASDAVFTPTRTPAAPMLVFRNGLLQRIAVDYTVTGGAVKFTSPLSVADQAEYITLIYSYAP
jgi:hypothetical protein